MKNSHHLNSLQINHCEIFNTLSSGIYVSSMTTHSTQRGSTHNSIALKRIIFLLYSMSGLAKIMTLCRLIMEDL